MSFRSLEFLVRWSDRDSGRQLKIVPDYADWEILSDEMDSVQDTENSLRNSVGSS
jgi:hypothetical protein